MKGDLFLQQLQQRVQIPPDPALLDYALYVLLSRSKRNLARDELAQRAGLDSNLLAFLEEGVAMPAEFTEEVRQRIESTLACPYETFMQLNKKLVEELKQDRLNRYAAVQRADLDPCEP